MIRIRFSQKQVNICLKVFHDQHSCPTYSYFEYFSSCLKVFSLASKFRTPIQQCLRSTRNNHTCHRIVGYHPHLSIKTLVVHHGQPPSLAAAIVVFCRPAGLFCHKGSRFQRANLSHCSHWNSHEAGQNLVISVAMAHKYHPKKPQTWGHTIPFGTWSTDLIAVLFTEFIAFVVTRHSPVTLRKSSAFGFLLASLHFGVRASVLFVFGSPFFKCFLCALLCFLYIYIYIITIYLNTWKEVLWCGFRYTSLFSSTRFAGDVFHHQIKRLWLYAHLFINSLVKDLAYISPFWSPVEVIYT